MRRTFNVVATVLVAVVLLVAYGGGTWLIAALDGPVVTFLAVMLLLTAAAIWACVWLWRGDSTAEVDERQGRRDGYVSAEGEPELNGYDDWSWQHEGRRP